MQKTAYGMRSSDWSSDVCSSDLEQAAYDLERSASFGRRIKCDVEAPVELAPIVEVLGRERHRKFALNGLHRLEISGFEARYRETDQLGLQQRSQIEKLFDFCPGTHGDHIAAVGNDGDEACRFEARPAERREGKKCVRNWRTR